MADETWFTSAECVEHGLANEVSDNFNAKMCAALDPKRFRHTPKALVATRAAELRARVAKRLTA